MTETQPAARPEDRARYQLYLKIAFLAVLVLGSLIPLMMVRGLVQERFGLSEAVKQDVSATWGRDQGQGDQAAEDKDGEKADLEIELVPGPVFRAGGRLGLGHGGVPLYTFR